MVTVKTREGRRRIIELAADALFPLAQAAYTRYGRGALVLEQTGWRYLPAVACGALNADLARQVRRYAPNREIVVVFKHRDLFTFGRYQYGE